MSSNIQINQSAGHNDQSGAASILSGIQKTAFRPLKESRITRYNPCSIVIMIDQSQSMNTRIDAGQKGLRSLSELVADAVNEILEGLILKCTRDQSVREYFDFLIIGYGNPSPDGVSVIWEGGLEGREWVSVKDLKENILERIETVETKTQPWGEQVEHRISKKIWIRPKNVGRTPMLAALKFCKESLEQHMASRSDNFPAVVYNITDGLPTDVLDMDDLVAAFEEIRNISTSFGNTIVFNCLLSKHNQNKVFLPTADEANLFAHNLYHQALYEASGELPAEIVEEAYKYYRDEKFNGQQPVKGVLLNVPPSTLKELFKIGTNTQISRLSEI